MNMKFAPKTMGVKTHAGGGTANVRQNQSKLIQMKKKHAMARALPQIHPSSFSQASWEANKKKRKKKEQLGREKSEIQSAMFVKN